MTAAAPDLILMIGRMEGKLDALVQLSSAQGQRLDQLEQRLAAAERALASMTGTSASARLWLANLIAALGAAAGLAAVALQLSP